MARDQKRHVHSKPVIPTARHHRSPFAISEGKDPASTAFGQFIVTFAIECARRDHTRKDPLF